MSERQILVTSGLPYVNAGLHVGHLVEFLQTDYWVRFQKLRGNECRFFHGDDVHGTATMLRAQQEGRKPEACCSKKRRPRISPTSRIRDRAGSLQQHPRARERSPRRRNLGGAARGRASKNAK